MNIFSWFNDTVIQSQWFLGSSDREIWYKTLFFHFINLTWPPHRDRITEAKVSSYSKDRNFTFRGEQAWHPLDNATPSNFLFPKSLDQELSADVSFVSVLAMFLSEYWKRLEEIFFIIFYICRNRGNNLFSKIFLQPFSIFWKNHKEYRNKRYISGKPLISALFWHPEKGRGSTRKPSRPLAVKSMGAREGFLTLCLLWHGHALMIMPRPLSGCQNKAYIKSFLLKYCLFLY